MLRVLGVPLAGLVDGGNRIISPPELFAAQTTTGFPVFMGSYPGSGPTFAIASGVKLAQCQLPHDVDRLREYPAGNQGSHGPGT